YFQLPFGLTANPLAGVPAALSAYQNFPHNSSFPNLTMFPGTLPNAYVESWFGGVEHRIGDAWSIEVNGLGALGRRLIDTDIVNRPGADNGLHGYNPLGPIEWRDGQGPSDYQALTAVGRYRTARAQFQIAWTWSHSIDNQSDPLLGEFFADLSYVAPTASAPRSNLATFSRELDSRADRGNSDFDQRQNLVFYSIWELPAHFQFAQMAAFRSGFPYTVYANSSFSIYNNRADLVGPNYGASQAVAGGVQLLNPAAFAQPASGALGNTARNAFAGPGLLNLDISL